MSFATLGTETFYDYVKRNLEESRRNKNLFWDNENNPLQFTAPATSGLYLIGNTLVNPHTNEKTYLIKVGKSKNLESRMQSYRTTNPGVFHISFFRTSLSDATNMENFFHYVLLTKFDGKPVRGCLEWFKVSEKNYMSICENEFELLLGFADEVIQEWHKQEQAKKEVLAGLFSH